MVTRSSDKGILSKIEHLFYFWCYDSCEATELNAAELLKLYNAGRRDFRGENLRGQNFKGKDLAGADFSGADIRSANFSRADLRGANFSDAKVGLRPVWAIAWGVPCLGVLMMLVVSSLMQGALVDLSEYEKFIRVLGWGLLCCLIGLYGVLFRYGINRNTMLGAIAGAILAAFVFVASFGEGLSLAIFALMAAYFLILLMSVFIGIFGVVTINTLVPARFERPIFVLAGVAIAAVIITHPDDGSWSIAIASIAAYSCMTSLGKWAVRAKHRDGWVRKLAILAIYGSAARILEMPS